MIANHAGHMRRDGGVRRAARLPPRAGDAPMNLYQRGGKRLFDVCVAVLLLLVSLPVVAVVALVVRLKLGRPVLFRQTRPGRNGHPFQIVKFRTMTDATDQQGRLLPDADRLTRFGAFLRSTSVDEIPELLNVIRGDMSLVGPRPLRVAYLERYSVEQARRHEVRSGITGWAQVNGRNNAPWADRLAMDVWYVDNYNLVLDIRILCRTVVAVAKRADVSERGHVTAQEFLGSEPRA